MSQRMIDSFKTFVKQHPGLINEVKKGKWTWKELYEEWQIFGEQDKRWAIYKKAEETDTEEGFTGFFSKIKNINLDEVQKNIVELKGLVQTIQEFVRELQPNRTQPFEHQYPKYNRFPYYNQPNYKENQKF